MVISLVISFFLRSLFFSSDSGKTHVGKGTHGPRHDYADERNEKNANI